MRDVRGWYMRKKLLLFYDMKPTSREGRRVVREKRKAEKEQRRMRALDEYDTKNYMKDLEYLARLSFIQESTRQWIEARMYELRESANMYEHSVGQLLMKMNVDFIHQAPFVFRPKSIYFCDFYLPESRIVIEVDGSYHNGSSMIVRDRERDYNFRSVGIWVIRVSNSEVKDAGRLKLRISETINKRLNWKKEKAAKENS